jgi:hypothetical protein
MLGDGRWAEMPAGAFFEGTELGADGLRGMANVAAAIIPVIPYASDLGVGERHVQPV